MLQKDDDRIAGFANFAVYAKAPTCLKNMKIAYPCSEWACTLSTICFRHGNGSMLEILSDASAWLLKIENKYMYCPGYKN